MQKDPIVEEVRQHREAHAAMHQFNSDSIFADIVKKQELAKAQGFKFVTLPPKPVQTLKTAA